MNPKIFFCVGDPSGDLFGSLLAKALKQLEPKVQLCGVGGLLMKEAGVHLYTLGTRFASIGLFSTLKTLPELLGFFRCTKRLLLKLRPDVFVPIDASAVNRRLTRFACEHGIKTVYYVSPSFFTKKLNKVRPWVPPQAKFVPIFPWQREVLESVGANVFYFGHPLLDVLPLELTKEEARQDLDISDKPTIALMPGSRPVQIQENLPVILKACHHLIQRHADPSSGSGQSLQFLLGAAPTVKEEMLQKLIERHAPDLSVKIVHGQSAHVLKASDAAILLAGTVTLEAACLGVPSVVIIWSGLANRLWARLKRYEELGFAALPNRLLQKEVMPEFILYACQPKRIAAAVQALLEDEKRRTRMANELMQVRSLLGAPGVSERVARLILETARDEAR